MQLLSARRRSLWQLHDFQRSSQLQRPLRLVEFQRLRGLVALLLSALLVFGVPSFCRADDDDTIDYRRHIMHSMGEQYAAIDMILQKQAPADSLSTQLHALSITASAARKAFEPKIPGGHAKAEVWQRWADFSKRLDDLSSNLTALAKAADSGGVGTVAPKSQAAFNCKSCHDVYSLPLEAQSRPAAPAASNAGDQNVIDYREHIMNTLNEQSDALGMILATTIPPDNAAAHLEIIALTASTALKAFVPKVPGGQSKPEVWSDWPDFSKRMNELAAKTADVAKIAQQKDAQAALPGVIDALTCKSCHEIYRQEKKK
jgi:cytochrome c556